ncbi:RHS repeat domain-containing protein [Flavobacterium gelatinilyticum]|uniref:RHS repeat domain-containing protein n=1 Tax=Flavobacterium gelatinilyticum TaxID=3003260 RepID=UPI00247FDFEB|nr:RHS repeat domain-containing protein [Flavobacterium gelatinilyticum]
MFNLIVKSSFRFLFSLFFLCIVSSSNAQNTEGGFLPNIIPPSPVAGELGKFGNVPVGLFTGSANLSVSLLTFKTKNLESPLSLSYGSNGIKVDEVASNVGLGWNLNVGGVITRTVRDLNDDSNQSIDIPNLYTATPEQQLQFYKAAGQDFADTERDIYSFNCNGISGKFVYDKNNVPVLVNNQKIKIERIGLNGEDFKLTAANGVQYFFTEKETTTFRNQGEGHSVISGSVTAWYLTKIAHPNNSAIVFTYEPEPVNLEYTASNSQRLMLSNGVQLSCSGPAFTAPILSGISSYNMKVIGKRITKISSSNSSDGYVTIAYYANGVNAEVTGNSKIESITQYNITGAIIEKLNLNYLKTGNSRVFLQNITYNDPSKKYSFEYIAPDSFPNRLSKSQDHWGYYNGKSNINLVPKNITEYGLNNLDYQGANKEPDGDFAKIGLLSKITYPTKGYTQFDYESNTYWGSKTTYPAKVQARIDHIFEDENGDNIEDYKNGKTITITSPMDQTITFSGFVDYADLEAPHEGGNGPVRDPLDKGNYTARVRVAKAASPTNYLKFYTMSQFGSKVSADPHVIVEMATEPFYFDAKAGQTYIITLTKNGIRTSAGINFYYYADVPKTEDTNIETGGVRIKSTKDFASAAAAPVYKRFYYGPKHDLNHSSGDKGRNPYYIDQTMIRSMCTSEWGVGLCAFVDNYYLTLSSSSLVSLFDTGSSNCFYKYVTTSEGGDNFENGGEMKEFIVNRDEHGSSLFSTDIKGAPLTNSGWDNGLELKSEIFKKKTPNGPFITIAETENKYKEDPAYSKEVIAYRVRKNYTELCPNVQTVDNMSMVEYKTLGHWFYLESSISKKYDLDGLNPVETQTVYKYGNPSHIQLTSQSTKSSLKENLETRYYYPHDLLSEPFVSEMIAGNRIDTPLKTETYRGTVKQSEQKTVFGKDASTADLLLPKFIYTAKAAASLEKKITFGKYDEKGNILEYTPENGTPVSIIWGYNKTQPIAKIENALYSQAASYAANLQDKSDTKTETELKEALGLFRTALPNAMITTYTYKPLVGVSTVTDPKGQTTTYTYDDFGRLDVVKDAKGNILSENQYRYKQ